MVVVVVVVVVAVAVVEVGAWWVLMSVSDGGGGCGGDGRCGDGPIANGVGDGNQSPHDLAKSHGFGRWCVRATVDCWDGSRRNRG